MKRLVAVAVLGAVSGCGVISLPSPMDDGHIIVSGDAAGMRAFGDSLSGLITNSKTQDPNGDSAYWQFRAHSETESTKRACKNCKGLWQKLTQPANQGS